MCESIWAVHQINTNVSLSPTTKFRHPSGVGLRNTRPSFIPARALALVVCTDAPYAPPHREEET